MARRTRRGLLARLLRAMLFGVVLVAGLVVLAVIAFRWIDPPTSAFMLRDRVAAMLDDEHEFRHEWRDFEQISREAALAVIAAEDQRFLGHRGFDFAQIDQALKDRQRGKRARGASTISQQVAKNLFLWGGQSWFRKGLEACITVLIEVTWSKRRILEVYLNAAEFGRGTWGVEAASQRFFHKSAAQLSRREAALLAAVLPNPIRLRADAPSAYLRKRQDWIQRQMTALGGTAHLAELDATRRELRP